MRQASESAQAAALRNCSDPGTRRYAAVTDFVAALLHASVYQPLSIDEMNAVTTATRALEAGDLTGALVAAEGGRYRIVPLVAASACYWLLQPIEQTDAGEPLDSAPVREAMLLYAASWSRNLIIEAPHAREDHQSDVEAALLLSSLRAKALIISGAHRCVSRGISSGCLPSKECDGLTSVAAQSDPSHSFFNGVMAMHLAFRSTDAITIQLHTNSHPELNGDALVSNGTDYAIEGTMANALYGALIAPGVDVRSCNGPGGAPPGGFCGATNTQSLASNGAADACLGHASSRGGPESHRFIHLEQSNQRLCVPGGPPQALPCLDTVDSWSSRIVSAVSQVIPVTR